MTRNELFSTEEGVNALIDKWDEYVKVASQALAYVTTLNDTLNDYFIEHKPLPRNAIACMGGFKRVNNMTGIYTTDLHKHVKALASGVVPNYSPSHLPELKSIDSKAQQWRKDYNEAVNLYKELSECYRLSLYQSYGTFDIANWL
ncbi:MAG TPA: hypothetical protein DCE48_12285 [Lachnospiraceae bacterium]|uniref:hypothetical protein n=1 Tax=Anaerosporobacter sp. TaxID=1872529 RepID=UPI000EE123D4|nr:hypothetical protein [Anaerosporobacter sp.]HAB61448.1 hypothetical protein [Lachnospiraceae bacterium]